MTSVKAGHTSNNRHLLSTFFLMSSIWSNKGYMCTFDATFSGNLSQLLAIKTDNQECFIFRKAAGNKHLRICRWTEHNETDYEQKVDVLSPFPHSFDNMPFLQDILIPQFVSLKCCVETLSNLQKFENIKFCQKTSFRYNFNKLEWK